MNRCECRVVYLQLDSERFQNEYYGQDTSKYLRFILSVSLVRVIKESKISNVSKVVTISYYISVDIPESVTSGNQYPFGSTSFCRPVDPNTECLPMIRQKLYSVSFISFRFAVHNILLAEIIKNTGRAVLRVHIYSPSNMKLGHKRILCSLS